MSLLDPSVDQSASHLYLAWLPAACLALRATAVSPSWEVVEGSRGDRPASAAEVSSSSISTSIIMTRAFRHLQRAHQLLQGVACVSTAVASRSSRGNCPQLVSRSQTLARVSLRESGYAILVFSSVLTKMLLL